MHRFVTTLALLLSASIGAAAQANLAFEVVSIKPTVRPTPQAVADGTARVGFNINPPRVEIAGFGLNVLVARAFQVENPQVDLRGLGGTSVFEVQAKMPEGSTPAQVPEMLQTMLAERFKFSYHRETREYPATVVTIGRNGFKLKRLPEDTAQSYKSERLSGGVTRTTMTGTLLSLFPVMNSFGEFPQMLDETGLEGIYVWVRDVPPPGGNLTFFQATRESFEAMMDAAGLKLETRKVPKETIVIDFVEPMPTEN